ncbi:MAG: type IV secretory system conjugative DNA transfer family protein, partial [Firmicutes bacterium]|nr:type IV secretory system conjugative DNA transfer family protein [Bacillota bacterium]
MEYYVHNEPHIRLYAVLFIIALYIGYASGTIDMNRVTFSNISGVFLQAVLHPFPIRFTAHTPGMTGISLLVWMMVCLYHASSVKNYMPGREYGTARLADPEELNRELMDENPAANKILSENLRVSTNTRKTGLNNNVLIIGGSGSGKTFYVVKPNGYNASGSMIFCDPKGELLRDIGQYLKNLGYRIVVLNLVNMDESDCYNPFDYIRSDEDVIRLITNLIANTTPKDSHASDPFWEKAEAMYLQAIMYYVWYEYPKQGKRPGFRGVLDLLNKAKIPENAKELSELDLLMYELPEDHPALIAYNKVRRGASDTVRSIIISANSRLAYMQNDKVLRILDHDDINIPWLGEGVM